VSLHRPLLLLAIASLGCVPPACLMGCGPNIRSVRLAPDRPVRAVPSEIRVTSVDVPQCPFEEFALIVVRETMDVHGDAVLEFMKGEAARMGGDAFIGLEQVPQAPKIGARGLSATIVRFSSESCRS